MIRGSRVPRRRALLGGAVLVLSACTGPGKRTTASRSPSTPASPSQSSPAPTAGRVSSAEADPARNAGPESDPSHSSSLEPDAPIDESEFSPDMAAQPGSYTQDSPDMWGVYAAAGAKKHSEDPTPRGTIPPEALSNGGDGRVETRVLGEIISDAETSAAAIRAAAGDGPLPSADAVQPGLIVNRYPDAVFIVPREADGALYVYAVSRDQEHRFSVTVKV